MLTLERKNSFACLIGGKSIGKNDLHLVVRIGLSIDSIQQECDGVLLIVTGYDY